MSTCVGLFLFTRIQIPDVMLTATTALAMWGFLRALEEHEAHPRLWAAFIAVSLGLGLLLKSLVGVLFPVAAGLIYLGHHPSVVSGAERGAGFAPSAALLIILAIAAPWHILAAIRNPPLVGFYNAQRRRRVPRVPLVLLHQ